MIKNNFNKIYKGKQIELFTLSNKNGILVEITNYGATIVSVVVPDKNKNFDDVVLGYDTLDDYIEDTAYFGSTIGRYANRIANGKFTISGKKFQTIVNNGKNHLHGGTTGFNAVVWDAEFSKNKQTLKLSYLSKDGEENYPGNLAVKITYQLTEENELKISYQATTDKTTIVNLTNHSYFNLASSEGDKHILNHKLMINANAFTPLNANQIPTGKYQDVAGTPMDFITFIAIGNRINNNDKQLKIGNGYDHNWVLKTKNKKTVLAAAVHEPISGRYLEVFTNQPGVQFYTGNFLDGTIIGKSGKPYKSRSAFCLETQHFPDAPNHSHFPSTVLIPNQEYAYTCIYKFSVK